MYEPTELQNQLLEEEGRDPCDIWIIACDSCYKWSYYNQDFTASCEHCGSEIAHLSDEAITLADLWDAQAWEMY